MNWKISSTLSSLAFLATGTLLNIAPASAAVIGTIEISGANIQAVGTGIDDPRTGSPITTIDFGFIGDPDSATPDVVPGVGEFLINSADGVFSGFNPLPQQAGRVKDLPVAGSFAPVDNFLSFASVLGAVKPATDPSTFTTDFDLNAFSAPIYTATATGINVSFDVFGTFTLADGSVVDGTGILGGEVLYSSQPGRPFNSLTSFFNYINVPGNVVNIDSWSGNLNAVENPVVPVPEPASVVGVLAAVGLAGGTLRKRQQKQ